MLEDIVELARELRVADPGGQPRSLDAAARTDAPQGVLAQASPLPEAELDDLARTGRNGKDPFLLCCDGITDPGNLGALLRSAECAGVSGVVLPRHRAVHITPTVAKAAAGAIEHLPMALVSGLPTALRRCPTLGGRRRRVSTRRPTGTLWDLDVGDGTGGLGARRRGQRPRSPVRQRCDHGRRHPDAWPAVVAQRGDRGRAGLLRDRPQPSAPSTRPRAPSAAIVRRQVAPALGSLIGWLVVVLAP